MRELSELITDIRFACNETDINRFPDERLLKFLNDAQDQIESVIFISCNENHPFAKDSLQNVVAGQEAYSLPSDVYAQSGIVSVSQALGGVADYFTPIRKLSSKERRKGFGYIVLGKKIYLSPIPRTSSTNALRITYIPKLVRFDSVTDTPELPDMCESFLTEFVERKVNAINSSTDISNSRIFTAEEKTRIADIFAENHHDAQYPPIVDETYLTY